MTAPTPSPTPDSAPPPDALWVERTGPRTYTGYSARGARITMGSTSEGADFTPGELLKIALAACAGMSSDRAFARRLGDDYAVTIRAGGVKHATEDRYATLAEDFELDMSALDDDARERLLTTAARAIDTVCTVGLTLENGASVTRTFTDTGRPAPTGRVPG